MAKKKEDIGLKVGSPDMVYWRDVIDARKSDIETTNQNLKYLNAILEMAEGKFKMAELEFQNKK